MNNRVSGILGNTLRRYLVIALAVSLAVTGGMFAYAYTTASVSITGDSKSADFARISSNKTGNTTFSVWGNYRGKIDGFQIFTVQPQADYTGDLTVNVYLDNLDELSSKYALLLMRIALTDDVALSNPVDLEGMAKPLTLNNGMVSFTAINTSNFTSTGLGLHVVCYGGVYRTFPWGYLTQSGGSYHPSFTAEVLQAGL